MLDIKFIRENKELIKDAARKKRIEIDIDALLDVDEKRKSTLQEVEALRAEQNEASSRIQNTGDPALRESLILSMREVKEKLQGLEEVMKTHTKKLQELMLKVPNIPDMTVPEGESEDDNKELSSWGEKPRFSFTPKSHVELMNDLDLADFERGVKVHGFRGYFLKNEGALLSMALWNYARDFYIKKGFTFVLAPSIVKKEFFYGSGHLPSDADDMYATQDDDYLSGTAEVPLMALHSDEMFKKSDLPKWYLAFSPCYRREAGSYGKDTKGVLRVHEFYKLEQLVLCEADHSVSVELHEELHRNMEEFIESLKIPYRQVVISTGDLKSSQVKCYDTELWVPSQEVYREIGSASYYHDFQTRRFNIRYDDAGVKRYAHSLNATAAPTPRLLIALLENFQQADGSVVIPEVLRPYMGGQEQISSRR